MVWMKDNGVLVVTTGSHPLTPGRVLWRSHRPLPRALGFLNVKRSLQMGKLRRKVQRQAELWEMYGAADSDSTGVHGLAEDEDWDDHAGTGAIFQGTMGCCCVEASHFAQILSDSPWVLHRGKLCLWLPLHVDST